MDKRAYVRARCWKKTLRGNVYKCRFRAEEAAKSMRLQTGCQRIGAYRCPVCRWWHLGKRSR